MKAIAKGIRGVPKVRVLILGGAGAMAEVIERDLLRSGVREVIIAGRDMNNLKKRIRLLKSKRIKAVCLDALDKNLPTMIKKLHPDILINAAWYEFNVAVMKAAIKARVHYVDLGGLYYKTIEQRRLHTAAKKAGVVCVLGMGSTPGTMNVMAGYAAGHLDRVRAMELRCGGRITENVERTGQTGGSRTEGMFTLPYALKTLIDEVTMKAPVLRHGKIQLVKPLDVPLQFTLPKPMGKVHGYYTIHSELATLPLFLRGKGIKLLDFAYAYDSSLVSVIQALAYCTMRPCDFLHEVSKRLPSPSSDRRDVEVLRVDAWGTRKGKRCFVRVEMHASYHPSWKKSAGSVDTGVPPSIIAQWIARGKLSKPGVWAPEEIIDPLPFFRELKQQGRDMKMYKQINHGRRRRLN